MSYSDDEEEKIGDIDELDEDLDVDLGLGLDDPLLDDDLLAIGEDDEPEEFAGLDGSAEY